MKFNDMVKQINAVMIFQTLNNTTLESGKTFKIRYCYYLNLFSYQEPSGRVIDEIWNKGTSFPDTKYYYGEPDHSKRIAITYFNGTNACKILFYLTDQLSIH
jgi:hypothetical protein